MHLDEGSSHTHPTARQFIRRMSVPQGTRSYWQGNCNLGQLTRRGHDQMRRLGVGLREIYISDPNFEWKGDAPEVEDLLVRSTDVWYGNHAHSFPPSFQTLHSPGVSGEQCKLPNLLFPHSSQYQHLTIQTPPSPFTFTSNQNPLMPSPFHWLGALAYKPSTPMRATKENS